MIDLSEIQTIEHDVLVVGAGGAGLRAAPPEDALLIHKRRPEAEPRRTRCGPAGRL